MRLLLAPAVIIAVFAAQALAQSPLAGEPNTARPGGVYTSLTVDDANACARLCAEDSICMAWTYRALPNRACELKAVVTPAVTDIAAVSGLSSRAPDFTRRIAAAAPAPVTGTPGVADEVLAETSPHEASSPSQNDSLVLLGGPGESDLRLNTGP